MEHTFTRTEDGIKLTITWPATGIVRTWTRDTTGEAMDLFDKIEDGLTPVNPETGERRTRTA